VPVNKSDKPVNGQIPKDISDAFSKREHQVSWEHLLGKEDISKISDKLEQLEAFRSQATDPLARQAAAENIGSFEGDLRIAEQAHASRYNEMLAEKIGTYSRDQNINKRTTTMSRTQGNFRQARSSEDLYAPSEVLEHRIQGGLERASSLGRELAGRVRVLGTDDMPENLKQKASEMGQVQEEIALNKRLLRVQNKEGLTTEKRQYQVSDTINSTGSFLSGQQLTKDVVGGKYGSLADETDKLTGMFDRLKSALEKFEEASENAVDAQGNLTEEYKSASRDLSDLQKRTEHQRKVVGEVQRHGGGVGGNLSNTISGVGGIVNTAYAMSIDDPMEQMRLRGAMAGRAVDQYNRVNSAVIGGDAASLIRETQSTEFIESFSNKMRGRAEQRAIVGAVASGADAINAGAIATGLVAGGPKGALVAGGLQVAGSATTMLRNGTRVARGIPQTNTAYDASLTAEGFSNIINTIGASGMQSVMDQAKNAGMSSIGGGTLATATEATLTDGWWLKNKAAQAGLSPQQAAALTQQSIRGIGGTEVGTSVALRAGQVEQTRLMSAQDYIGMSSGFADFGGGTADTENIMKNAVAAGIENAKVMQQMAQATMAMSNDLSKMGSGPGSAQNMVGGAVQNLVGMGINQNIASKIALSAQQFQAGTSKDIGLDIGTISEMGGIGRIDSKSSLAQRMRIASLTQGQLDSIMEGGKEEASKYGLGSVWDRIGKDGFSQFAQEDRKAQAYKLDLHVLNNETFSQDKQLASEGRFGEMSEGAKAIMSMASGTMIEGQAVAGRKAVEGVLPSAQEGFLEQTKIQAAGRQADIFNMGAGDNINETLSFLTTALQALADNLSPEKSQERVERGAREMKDVEPIVRAGDTFNNASAVFEKAVKEFNGKLGRSGADTDRVRFNLKEENEEKRPKLGTLPNRF